MKINKSMVKDIIFDILGTILGSASFAFGIHYFTAPNNIAPGGVSGIATFINHLTGFPIGVLALLINIPIIILGFIYLGKTFVIKSGCTILTFTFFLDVIFKNAPTYKGDLLLAAVFGGVLIGLGLSIVFMRQSSTGGTDIIVKLTQLAHPHYSMGKLLFAFDVIVIVASTIVYQNLESGLYATITIFVSARVVDSILYGKDVSKKIMIISEKPDEIARTIIERMHRGVTFLKGEGAYTGKDKKVLLVCARKNEFFDIKKIVKEVDDSAFMMISDVSEVLGQGFKNINNKNL